MAKMFLRRMTCTSGETPADGPPVALVLPLAPEIVDKPPDGWRLIRAAGVPDALAILAEHEIPLVLCHCTADSNWREAVRMLAAAPSKPCVVLLSPSLSAELWEQATACGGYDVLRQPVTIQSLRRTLRAGLWHWRSKRRLQTMRVRRDP